MDGAHVASYFDSSALTFQAAGQAAVCEEIPEEMCTSGNIEFGGQLHVIFVASFVTDRAPVHVLHGVLLASLCICTSIFPLLHCVLRSDFPEQSSEKNVRSCRRPSLEEMRRKGLQDIMCTALLYPRKTQHSQR